VKGSFQMLPGGTLQFTGTAATVTTGANNNFTLLGTSAKRVKLQALGGAVTLTGGGVYDLGHIEVMNGVWLNKGATITVASCVAQLGSVVPKEWNCQPSTVYTPLSLSAVPMPGATLKDKVSAMAQVLQAQNAASCLPMPAGALPLYRLYKSAGFDHFYTTKPADRARAEAEGYKYEGTVGFVLPTQTPDTVPLHKLYLENGADHFYTTKDADVVRAKNEGYRDEGVEAYVYAKETPGCIVPLYRLYNGGLISDHFYTTDPVERYRSATRDGYSSEGIDGYVLADPEAIKERKNPVMIVGGTFAAEILYWILESRLANDGYVYRFFELPEHGTIDINASADKLSDAVDAFLRDTGASKVHLIAHSQGGIVARDYISRHAGQNTVESMISLAAPHKGTSFVESDLAKLLFKCPDALPCQQVKIGAPLIQQINNRPANDSIYYTNFTTNNDIFITPVENGWMDGCDRVGPFGGNLSCNIHIQRFCPGKIFLEHIGLAFDGTVYNGIQQALRHQEIVLNCSL